MFFRFYNQPGLYLSPAEQRALRKELLEVGKASLDPMPNYQCLSSRPNALDDKLIVVAYIDPENSGDKQQAHSQRAVAFTSAIYLDVPNVDHVVLHTGLTIAIPSLQRTGILAQLFTQLFANVVPLHPRGMWVTTLAAVLSSLVQSEKTLYKTHPCPPERRQKEKQSLKPLREHLHIARAIDERHRAKLLISPAAVFDDEAFVFRESLDWDAAASFRKDVDDVKFHHRDNGANQYFRGLMRAGKGDEVLLIGFFDGARMWEVLEQRLQKSKL
ncbi:hypothetical protein DFH07DRAFT_545311 [Mycena maculata]|uniref:Uncharacterized protein n=1 Tax=Mycena maculata TaxID=230809 RepID=A0AAD7IWY9_9AGAR|nr:hypothetical protein DFH07DRAFT_545311 [Mycena maculata]